MTKRVVKVRRGEEGKLLVSEGEALLSKLDLGHKSVLKGVWVLDVAEAAYLIFTEAAQLEDEEGPLDLARLFAKYSRSKYDWIRFVVLLNLRERGRRAKVGFGVNDIIYGKGSDKAMVFVIEENSPLRAGALIEWTRDAIMKGYEPVIAVVDAHGDVTYYSTRVLKVSDLREVVKSA